jgi:hypothetical protein
MAEPDAEFATCAIEVEYDGKCTPRLAGRARVTDDDLARSRMAMLHSSSFLIRRAALPEELARQGVDASRLSPARLR